MELVSIEGLTKKPLPWEDTLVMPIGDIQLQTNRDAVDVKRLRAAIKFGVENNAWFIGMGDYIDLESPSNRRMWEASGFYDSLVDAVDSKAEELEEEVQDILKPTIGRWLGILEGHHYHRHQDGTTTDTRLANFLKAPFLGTSAYVNLTFKSPKGHVNPQVNIWCHHGRNGGKLLSTPLNQLEHIIKGFDADIYLIGHHHKAAAAKPARIYPVFGPKIGTLNHKEMIIASCGSFLKGWAERHQRDGRASGMYAEAGMMNPLALGSVKLWIRPKYEADSRYGGSGVPRVEISAEV
jgi:hypothetical protein